MVSGIFSDENKKVLFLTCVGEKVLPGMGGIRKKMYMVVGILCDDKKNLIFAVVGKDATVSVRAGVRKKVVYFGGWYQRIEDKMWYFGSVEGKGTIWKGKCHEECGIW